MVKLISTPKERSISPQHLVEQECNHLLRGGLKPVITLDTHAFYFRYNKTPYRTAITSGVMDELAHFPNEFPEESLYRLSLILNPTPLSRIEFISSKDEALILRASTKYPKKDRVMPGIGWVDTEQIVYSLIRARNNERTVLVSNDPDILLTMKALREELPEMRDNAMAVSISHYLERKNRLYLENFSKEDRIIKFAEIQSSYLIAA